MHPAYSIIIFTTLSGLGYGLAVMLGLGFLDPSAPTTKIAYLAALALISTGLLASLLHLGNPQRAWRALSQWRSSWLSREGVMAIATFVPLTSNAALCLFMNRQDGILGLITVLGALVTVYCTSMIYASLKTVDSWHTRLTPLCFLLFSLAGGALLAPLFSGANGLPLQLLALLLLLLALAAKMVWRKRARTLVPLSTPESATGLGSIGKVRLLERPHALDNYLTREMGFRVARKHAEKLWVIAFASGIVLPVLALLAAMVVGGVLGLCLTALAVLTHLLGLFVERWLFFAEAKHAVMNYY
ncbi:dimethyl sulfoxide reductase anchor subunit family protein [Phyllobacterium myrsinacearum]|uniref:DMSO reductase n=1 Tax=Phyllobacterium myrsinacearum TaxID=28101 RepID=A0A2S9JXL8_9HYPH|nr:DmsC/YnfH family molybdoenzyme membrane anchor subunit [Phyllobacterium myrsinacearum]PRD58088.1 DMSO reductase [Phyllobacterium myrsinacearum]PWV96281.1 DMSO reductase anchor subunit [Phyllobacterium myrsinacearum]RZV09729.1 DMSO reductase anchor subunit [Phyllobacterium myrsinacearum]